MQTPLILVFWKLFRFLFWLTLWVFNLSLLIWYPLRWWPGDRLRLVQLLNYFMPWLLMGLMPGLFIAGLARRKWLALTLALSTGLISLNFVPLFLPRSVPALALINNETLKVMSHNIWRRNGNIPAIAQTIRQEQADIVLLQEVPSPRLGALTTELAALYPHIIYSPDVQQAIISKYHLTLLETDYKKGRVQKVKIDTPTGPITVWNIHFSTPNNWDDQIYQATALAQDILATSGPLIVGGDFNTTDQSEVYRLINRQLQNAHWQAGWGFGFSFPARIKPNKKIPIPLALIRIDHIFYSPHFYVNKAGTLSTAGGSDHAPIIAEFILTR